jgi:HK97 family phage portal protein
MASFFDRFRNLLTKNAQQTAQEYNKAIYNWLGESIVWNPENDTTYINEGYRKNSTVYSLVNIIAKAASSIPFQVYEKVNDNDYKRYKAMNNGILDPSVMHKANYLKKKALVELHNTDLHKLLERPNPAQSYASWITELIAFGKLTGNRYIYGIAPETGNGAGKYKELYVMPSQLIEIISGGYMQPVKEYAIEYNGQYKIPADQICHIKDFNPYFDGSGSHLYGQSPLRAGLRSMTTNNEAVQTGVKYLQNQTARGVLMSDEGDLNEVQAQQLKDKFRKNFQGADNAGDIIITPKKLSWVNFGLNASDVSLIEQYNASIKDLCNIYNVPVTLLNNTESSTFNNVKEAKKALYQNCVIPELNKIQDELNRWLAPKYGEKLCIEFDYSVIPELQEETEKVVNQMAQAWWLTPNEKRAAMSFGTDEENPILDDYYIPANLIPASGNDIDLEDPQPAQNDEEVEKMFLKAEVSARTEKALKKKVEDHNSSVEAASKKTNLGTLKAVFKRGVGAYNTNPSSVRPNVSSADQWAMARVNSFLYALKNGKYRGGKHDTDLLPEGHPMSSKKEMFLNIEVKDGIEVKATYNDYPQSATNNAKRVKNWIEKHGRDEVDGMTEVGLARMNQLIARESLSLSTLKRTFSFLSRTKGGGYDKINPDYRDTPWRDKGYVAFLGWGGQSMLTYADKKLKQIENE